MITLVVTIIVLIILATVSINTVFGENGIIKKAEQSSETYQEAQAKEKLSLKLAEYKVEIYEQGIKDATLRDSYLCTKLSELGPTQVATDTKYYEVDVDGWLFWVDRETLEIASKGKVNTVDATKVTASNIQIKEGQTASISVTIEPEGASIRNVTYKSSDESIATVSNGTVTGVNAGTATITIKTKDGHEETFEVIVSEVEVESISLDKTTLKVETGKTSEALVVTFNPTNATNKTITWTSDTTSVATVDENTGVITGVAEGTAIITATTVNGKTATCSITVGEVGMTIAEAKAAIQKDGLQAHIGDLVEYNPTAGGKWRVFYYDTEGEFGTAGKLYLKRDYDSSLTTILDASRTYSSTDEAIIKMKTMNPKWRDSTYSSSIDLDNEKSVAWLCNPANWTDYKTTEADYAIGSPSVEMYMKAFNVWKYNSTNITDATQGLICKVESTNGYSVGANGTYANSGCYTNNNTIEAGPNNIFMTTNTIWWLASPSSGRNSFVLIASGVNAIVGNSVYSNTYGVCPVVSL